METSDNQAEAMRFARRFVRILVRMILGLVSGRSYDRARGEFEEMFPEATGDEKQRAMEETPPHLRWWAPLAAVAPVSMAGELCPQCGVLLGTEPVKQCPECRVCLHAKCYDDSLGGFETPGCECCRRRCY